MSLTTSRITELAPDQASLNAAHSLTKPSKWSTLSKSGNLVWGECQGSGANPYRTVFDHSNIGYKCTCPSRKFPCKHVLALMWMHVEDSSKFTDVPEPQWVHEWLGRRRTTSGSSLPPSDDKSPDKLHDRAPSSGGSKSLLAAQLSEASKPIDPKVEARQKAAAEKRAQTTRLSIASGIDELQQWIEDQARVGFASLLHDPVSRCRTIAARLVDAKAQALASRLDELPSRLMQVRSESRLDALIQELGRIVLIGRAWRAQREDAELTRLVGSSETRESILESPETPRVTSTWEVVGEQITTRRDGLVSQAIWLLNLGEGIQFALLLDFFPASLGKRASAFTSGEQFEAELAFYPARQPLRAVIARRITGEAADGEAKGKPWPEVRSQPLEHYRQTLRVAPWISEVPLLLPGGHISQSGSSYWWEAQDRSTIFPLASTLSKHLASMATTQAVGLWDGIALRLLSGQSEVGRFSYVD